MDSPSTILKEDVIPEARKSTDYLRKKNIRILDSNGDMINLDSVNWMSPIIQSYTFRQDPGPANALGVVKFMFPNPYSIYLHDTPSKELFSKTDRAFSSGCIRVENPLSLAEYLLNDRQKWNEEEIKKVIASNTTQTVTLKQQPDIHILYWTCWEKNGDIFFRKDIYERDSALLKALKESPRIDIGN